MTTVQTVTGPVDGADLGRTLQKTEQSLRESEERFSGAFEHAPIGVALVSPEGRWLKVNLRQDRRFSIAVNGREQVLGAQANPREQHARKQSDNIV